MRKIVVIVLVALVFVAWITGLRLQYVSELYVPICPNYKSMVVEAICTDWPVLSLGRCNYLRVIKECND